MELPLPPKGSSFEDDAFRMFVDEWRRQRGTGAPQRVAIVDDGPDGQYLYPEFVLAQRVLAERGVDAVIADAGLLRYAGGRLSIDGQDIDLVYNRPPISRSIGRTTPRCARPIGTARWS